jgi:TetR/AcrR family transcriptional regulator, repressor for neighboring sulfatase
MAEVSKAEVQEPRIRRSADDARRQILEAAERRLIAGGPDAVRVQTVARDVGVTDPAVHYHFGNREGLLEALLRHCGRRLRDDLMTVASRWDADSLDMRELVDLLDESYDRRRYARLTAWMRLGGWQPRGSGMLSAHVDALHSARSARAATVGDPGPSIEDTQFMLALVNLVAWAEALIGESTLRMVGLPSDRGTVGRFRHWFATLVSHHVRHTTEE